MDELRRYFEKDNFAVRSAIELLDVSPGWAIAKMIVGNQHLNSCGTVHGGAVFTLADFAFAAASNACGTIALAVNISISYFKSVPEGTTLIAEAHEIKSGNRLLNYKIEIREESGEIVAHAQAMAYKKKESISEKLS